MFGREHHVGCAEKCVGARCKNTERVAGLGFEIDFGAFAPANPVALLLLDGVGPVDVFEVGEQAFGVFCDAENPLPERSPVNFFVTFPVASAVGVDFFVGEYGFAAVTPPDRNFSFVGETLFVELEKNPLRPLEIFGVGRVNFPVPIVTEAEHLDLPAEGVDVLFCGDGGMGAGVDGVLFRW